MTPEEPVLPPREMWPCVLIEIWHARGERHSRGFQISADGMMQPFSVGEVRIEPVSATQERLMVNGVQVRSGDIRIDGRRRLRVGLPLKPLQPAASTPPSPAQAHSTGARPEPALARAGADSTAAANGAVQAA